MWKKYSYPNGGVLGNVSEFLAQSYHAQIDFFNTLSANKNLTFCFIRYFKGKYEDIICNCLCKALSVDTDSKQFYPEAFDAKNRCCGLYEGVRHK